MRGYYQSSKGTSTHCLFSLFPYFFSIGYLLQNFSRLHDVSSDCARIQIAILSLRGHWNKIEGSGNSSDLGKTSVHILCNTNGKVSRSSIGIQFPKNWICIPKIAKEPMKIPSGPNNALLIIVELKCIIVTVLTELLTLGHKILQFSH